MELLKDVIVLLHFMGWAALFGGMVVQLRSADKRVNAAMRDGVGTAFVCGLILVGIAEAGTDPVNHAKVAVKFVIGLVLLGLTMANLRKERLANSVFTALLALTVTNMAVAIFWE